MNRILEVAALAAGALAFVGTANAAAGPSQCSGGKIKAAGKLASCEVGAYAKATSVDLSKCRLKFAPAFSKAESAGDCIAGTGDASAIQAKVESFTPSENATITTGGPSPSKCQGAKLKAAGKKASCKLGVIAKGVSNGLDPDLTKLSGCEAKFSAASEKADGGSDCGAAAGDTASVESDVDAFVTDADIELTTIIPAGCCSAVQIVTVGSAGTLEVSTLPAFPFPANVHTTINVGPADADCKHTGIVPAGGFTVPVFCVPALQFTSSVTAIGCASGGADGTAVVWDGGSTNPQPDVTRVGDTSDPGGASCGTLGTGCVTIAGGAGADTAGNIDTTRAGNANGITGKVHTTMDIPVHSLAWIAADASCPDSDGTFDPGTDVQVMSFDFILSPTTGHTTATYTDLNGDGCKRAGDGPDSKTGDGTPANGPCCTVGQATTVSATGIAFTGGAPLYDITFRSITPTTISACDVPVSEDTCTLTTNTCQD
jgi:hypothetical protein